MTLLHTPQIHIQILAYSVRIKLKKNVKITKIYNFNEIFIPFLEFTPIILNDFNKPSLNLKSEFFRN